MSAYKSIFGISKYRSIRNDDSDNRLRGQTMMDDDFEDDGDGGDADNR